jgi:hypothetical protein
MKRTLVIIAAVAIAACQRDAAESDSTSVSSGSVDSALPQPLHVTERGIGAVHAGMTVAELRAAVEGLDFKGQDSTGCVYPAVTGLPEGVMVMVDRGIVARIDVQKGELPTTEGIRIGDDSAKVRSVYGSRVAVSPHKYTDGQYLTVTPDGDTKHRIIFETNNAGVVLRYRAGQLPQVGWVESCS